MTDQSDLSIPVLDVEKIKDSTRFYEFALKRYRDAAADLDAAAADLYLATRPNISISSPSTNGSPGESGSEQAPAGGGAGEGGGKGRPSKKPTKPKPKKPTKPKPKKPKRTKAPNKPKKSSTSKPVEKVNTAERHPIAERLERYFEASGTSVWTAPWPADLEMTAASIHSLLKGKVKSPRPEKLKSLERALDAMESALSDDGDKTSPDRFDEESGLQFIKDQVTDYIGHEDTRVAAMQLSISASVIEDIQIGIFPHQNVVAQLARHIPAIDKRCGELIALAKKARA